MTLFDQIRQFHQNGDHQQAQAGYQALLAQDPDNPQLCYLLALVSFEQGEKTEASHWFRRTIELAPEAAPAHYNLGVILFDQGDYQQAAVVYQEAARLCPDDGDIFFNLALTWKKLGCFQQAMACYQQVLSLDPGDQDSLYNMGVLHKDMGEPEAAINRFEELLTTTPDHAPALNNLGYLYHCQDYKAKAIATYRKLIALDHNAAMATHMLAALNGETTAAAPDAYIRAVFDEFSDHYDESLVTKLGYTTPALLREMLTSSGNQAGAATLDMGCGTGLAGEAFHDLTTSLTGLDLSAKMLALADHKGVYSSLHESDICSFLRRSTASFDLFLAADVFVYIGDLREIFSLVRARAGKGACFLFSTEIAAQHDFVLKDTGRYGHSLEYIDRLAHETGFEVIEVRAANIRKEKGAWIPGNLYLLRAAPTENR